MLDARRRFHRSTPSPARSSAELPHPPAAVVRSTLPRPGQAWVARMPDGAWEDRHRAGMSAGAWKDQRRQETSRVPKTYGLAVRLRTELVRAAMFGCRNKGLSPRARSHVHQPLADLRTVA